ncbi:MAG: TonB-dependent receptor [Tenuifilum sp.]|uniref:TonB-dependent receptor plug domain-containing protein n=1 Tax=Tenuifilum sp. TaxID=2760880 RepID=UPI00309C8B9F
MKCNINKINLKLLPICFASITLCLGYPAKAQVDTSLSLADLLLLPIENLIEIPVVTSALYEQKLWESASKTFVITRADIENRGYFDLTDALRDAPYFQLQSEYGHWMKGAIVNLRGHRSGDSGNNKFLILIDGVKLSDEAEEGLFLGLNSIPLSNVKQIEIVYGPNSTLYGRDAYAGMINIITETDDYSFGNYSYGSFNTQRIGAGLTKNVGTSKWVSLNYSSYTSDEQDPTNKSVTYKNRHVFPTHPYTERFYRGTRNSMYNVGLGWGGLKVRFLQNNIEASETYGCNPDFYVSEYSTVTALTNQILHLEFSKNITAKGTLSFSVYHKKHELDPRTANLYTADLGRSGTINFADSTVLVDSLYAYGGRKYYYFRTLTTGFKTRYFYQPSAKLNITSGIDFDFINGIPIISEGKGGKPITTEAQRSRWEHSFNTFGAYSELNWKLGSKFFATAGGRLDYSSDYGLCFNPRMALVSRKNKFVYKVIFAQGYLAPSVTQRYFESKTTFSWIKPNPNLRPERNYSIDIDATYIANNIQVTANLFGNHIRDGIVESYQTGDSVYVQIGNELYYVPLIQSLNLFKGFRYGCNIDATLMLNPNFDFYAGYSFLTGHDGFNGTRVLLSNNLISTHTITSNLTYRYHKILLNAGIQWYSSRKILSPHVNTLYSNFVDSNGYINFDPVLLVNVNVKANNIWKGLSGFLHIENLLNTEYYGQTINANWGSPKILQDLRRIDFGIEIRF